MTSPKLLGILAVSLLLSPLARAQSFSQKFGHVIDLDNLDNYANQSVPAYITKDNGANNPITDMGATLGRILFHDKKLSVNRTTSCATCHSQVLGFSDDAQTSQGENGLTGRHSMRLINSRFSAETRFFWNERATSLEDQTTQPIQDHLEMGFSGQDGQPDISALLARLSTYPYYAELFTRTFGDAEITEPRLQLALAQFIRSIQSFDSRYDTGRSQAPNDGAPFPNFTAQENQGKQLFLAPPQFAGALRSGGGLGCAGCHQPPEFDIAPNSGNNGVIGVAGGTGTDLTNTRSPSLRDLFRPIGTELNGPLMHDGSMTTFDAVLDHYNSPPLNPQIDPRLRRPGNVRINLNMTTAERAAVTAFMRTLTGSNVYFDTKWSDPFATPPTLGIDSFEVGNSAINRSLVTQITVIFNREVTLESGWLELTNLTTNEMVTSTQVVSSTDDGRTLLTITFNEGPSVEARAGGNSLADGQYELRIHGDLVSVVGSTETLGADWVLRGFTDGMYRLFGDIDGDGAVGFFDFIIFRQAYGSDASSELYDPDFDVDGDAVIGFLDFIRFRFNFGTSL